ncbi:VanZ family protein [Clostridium sp. SY8519]|uniref:VanZ family protein n=1 Tax=Clostridium sp. (strain SY8519) TaxID=1042156 RepID=UPI0011D1C770|nr:VanZ family protein [Clostridium sp. SY8519]
MIWGLFWRKEKLTIGWNMIRWLFCIYFTAILLITRVISNYGWHFSFVVFNIRPFPDGFSGQVLMNLLLFLPFGALLPFVFRKMAWNYGRVLFSGFAVSAAIELIQFFFVGRYADITDVMMNTAGTAAGALVYRWISIRFSAEELKKKKKQVPARLFFAWNSSSCCLPSPIKRFACVWEM